MRKTEKVVLSDITGMIDHRPQIWGKIIEKRHFD